MAGLLQDLRYGLRSLLKTPGFTAVVVLTIAVGVGANTAMFGVIHAALLAPLPYPEPDRLVLASTTFDGHLNPWTSTPDWYDVRDQAGAFERLAATASAAGKVIVTGGERPERVAMMRVSDDLFATLGVPPVAGRWFVRKEGQSGGPFATLVSEAFARRRFGSAAAAVGRALTLSGVGAADVSPTIVGVMPASFRFLDDADLWMPMRRGEDDAPRTRQFHNWLLVGRLKPGVTLEQAQRQVDAIAGRLRQEYPDSDRGLGFRLDRLQSGLLLNQTPSLLMLMAAVGLVLLIACANVAGLLLARGAGRRSELAVRAALGASRTRLVRQLLAESVLLASVAGLAGIVLASWLERLLPHVTGLARAGIAPDRLGGPVLLFALAVSLTTGLLFGLAPAMRASSIQLSDGLASGTRATERRAGLRLRGVLVVGQIALSLALLVGAGLLVKSFAKLASTDLGFDVHDVLTGEVQLLADKYPDAARQSRFFDGLRQDLDAVPGVMAVGVTDHLPIRHPYGNVPVWPEGKPPAGPSDRRTADFRRVLPGYFDALGMHLLAGRDISTLDAGAVPNVAVVNDRMARELFPDASALGHHVVVDGAGPGLMTFEIRRRRGRRAHRHGRCTAAAHDVRSGLPVPANDDVSGNPHRAAAGWHGGDRAPDRGSTRPGRRRRQPGPARTSHRRLPAAPARHGDHAGRLLGGGAAARHARAVRDGGVLRDAADARDWRPHGARREPLGRLRLRAAPERPSGRPRAAARGAVIARCRPDDPHPALRRGPDRRADLRAHRVVPGERGARRQRAACLARGARRPRTGVTFGVTHVRNDTCSADLQVCMVTAMLNDLRHGLRSLLRSPGFTAVAVLTLALGIAATTSIFSIVETSLLHPLPFADPGRLVYLRESKMPQLPEFSVAPANFVTWEAETHSFEAMGALASRPFNLTGGGEPERVIGDRTTANLFGMLGLRPVIGRDFEPADDVVGAPPVVLLSYALWQRRFGGDPSVLGRALTLNGTDYTVVGVMPAAAEVLRATTALWVPMAFTDRERHELYGSHYMRAIGRLKPGVTLAQARADLDVVARRLEADNPRDDTGWRVLAFPYEQYAVRDVRAGLLILIGAVGLVLLVACANVANLQLARGLGRHKELAIRAALGAGRGELVTQLLSESLITALAGGAVGLLVAGWMLRALLALSPAQLPRAADVGIDLPALAFVLGASMLALLIFGLVPALQVSRVDLRDALNTGGRGDRPGLRRRTRRALIVGEIAMATMLLVVSGLAARSFVRVQDVDPGFAASGAIAAGLSLPDNRYPDQAAYRRFFTQLVDRVRALPGVTAAGVTESLPFFSDNVEGVTIGGRPPVAPADQPSANYYSVTPGYFTAMGIRLVRGRLFTEQDGPDAPRVCVINERFAKELFPGQDPLGQRLEVSSSKGWREIVGIAADTKQYDLTTDTTKQVYDPFAQHPMQGMTLVVRAASDPAAVAGPIRDAVRSLDPDLPVGTMQTLSDLVAESVAPQRFSMLLLGAFALSALFLAAIGLYSVISYSVSQRTNEVGIRVAHGAQRGDIVWLVLREGLGLTLLGVVIGLAGFLAAGRLMSGFLFGVAATDPATLAAAPLVLLAIAALACLVPAWRAARLDPIVTLRAV